MATFAPAETSVAAARRLVSSALTQWGADDLLDDATLLVSELVTNAVVHAGTDLDVAVILLAEAVEVAVTDRHPARALPGPPSGVDEDREGGRGLVLTAALASTWGIDYGERTKRVWFRLPLASGAVPPPQFVELAGDRADDAADGADGADATGEPIPGVATLRLDDEGFVIEIDDHAAALLGRTPHQLIGKSLLSLCHPDDTETVITAAATPRWQGSYELRRGDGRFLRVQARHIRFPGNADRGRETVCVLVDHRLRVLLSDGPSGPAPLGVADGPFATSPESLVRLELDEVLERTVAWARDTLGGDGAYALLVTDEDGGDLEVRAAVGLRGDIQRVPRQAGGGVTGGHDRDLLPVVDDDLAASRAPHGAWLRDAGMRSLVSVPVLAEGRLIGSVGVTSSGRAAFTVAAGARLQHAVDGVALAVQSARVAEIERRRHGWLGYLAEASELLAGTLELDMAVALVAQLVAPQLGPWCAIHLIDESGRPVPATVWHADEDRIEDLRALFEAVLAPEPSAARGVTRWLPVPGRADHLSAGPRELAEAGGHVVALTARGRALGTLTVGHRGAGDVDGGRRQQLHLLDDLAPRAALALDNARLYAERTATSRALQRSLLPPELPSLVGVEVGVVYEATGAGNDVGGDFYDIFRTAGPLGVEGEHFAFAVGDVCGKGPEAAAVTGLARHALRLLGRRGDGIESVLGHLNEAILGEGSRARFVTVVYGEGERMADGSLDLRFASAGHPAPVVVRRDGSAAPVGESGDLLGVLEDIETRITSVRLAPGESLVCFTDGVTERRAGDRMLGEEGVVRAVSGTEELSAPALAGRLGDVVTDFTPEPTRDDLAILVLRATPADPSGQTSTTSGMIIGRRR